MLFVSFVVQMPDLGGRFGLVPKRSSSAAQARAGDITAGRVGSPMCSRFACTEGFSMTKATIFISAPQYRHVRANCSERLAILPCSKIDLSPAAPFSRSHGGLSTPVLGFLSGVRPFRAIR